MEFIWYSIINGLLFLLRLFTQYWYWIIGMVAFIIVYFLISKDINEEYVDDMRDIV